MTAILHDPWALRGCVAFGLSIAGAVALLVRELRAGRAPEGDA